MGEQAVAEKGETLWKYEDPADVVEIFPCPMGRPFDIGDRLHHEDTYCLDNDTDFRIPVQSPWIECSWFGLAAWVDVGRWKEIDVQYDTYRKRDPKKEVLPSTFGVNYAYSVLRASRVAYRVQGSSEWEVCFPYSLEYLGEGGRYEPDPMIGGTKMIGDAFRVTTRILTGGVPRSDPRIRISFLGSEKPRPIPLPSIKIRGVLATG
jgi:hypothetical protein